LHIRETSKFQVSARLYCLLERGCPGCGSKQCRVALREPHTKRLLIFGRLVGSRDGELCGAQVSDTQFGQSRLPRAAFGLLEPALEPRRLGLTGAGWLDR
jgi:hypothetical protein